GVNLWVSIIMISIITIILITIILTTAIAHSYDRVGPLHGEPRVDDLPGSITALQEAYRRRRLSPVEVTRVLLDRAERLQSVINAFITLTPEQAMVQARAAEQRLLRGDTLPLLGVPITLKDVYDQRGVPTTAGSGMRRDAFATADALVVRRLFRAGAV